MDAVLQRGARNSELAVAKEKRSFLTYPADGLAACALEEHEDGIVLAFNPKESEPAEVILGKSREEKLRFLINSADLSELYVEYDFSLSPDNLLIDINLRPQVLMRDAKRNTEFLPRYMALIGSVLLPRYKYEDYLNGGQDLYRKNKLLSELVTLTTANDIKDRLFKEYRRVERETRETKSLVPRRNVLMSRIAVPLLAAALLTATFFLGKSMLQDIPYKDNVIAANTAYIAGDYIGVQQFLENYELTALSNDTKYFLARASVVTEALTDGQKENILINLTSKTDPVIFDYWILLGRLDFAGAIDIAQRLGDDELLLFAYLKDEVIVKNDPTLTGEEKTSLLSDLENKINNLSKTRDEAAANASNTP